MTDEGKGKGVKARGSKTWGKHRPLGAKRRNKPLTRLSAVTLHSLSKQKRKAIRLTLNALITPWAKSYTETILLNTEHFDLF